MLPLIHLYLRPVPHLTRQSPRQGSVAQRRAHTGLQTPGQGLHTLLHSDARGGGPACREGFSGLRVLCCPEDHSGTGNNNPGRNLQKLGLCRGLCMSASLTPHYPVRRIPQISSSPFHRGGNRGTKTLSELSKAHSWREVHVGFTPSTGSGAPALNLTLSMSAQGANWAIRTWTSYSPPHCPLWPPPPYP